MRIILLLLVCMILNKIFLTPKLKSFSSLTTDHLKEVVPLQFLKFAGFVCFLSFCVCLHVILSYFL